MKQMIDEEDRAWSTPSKPTKESRKGFMSAITGRNNSPRHIHDRVSPSFYCYCESHSHRFLVGDAGR